MRYIIGIDLGTTNSCVSYVDTQDPRLAIQMLRIPQVVSPGYVEARPTLPSFCYLSGTNEWPNGALTLPWKENEEKFVGFFAQEQGAKVPTRLVQSAKSWLCHSAANRKDKILPFEAANEEQRISPIEASEHYLSHIKESWNHLMARSNAEAEFEQQEIVLTIPASFDEVARRLTVEAAKNAGYLHLTLLEEPQAAFYSWIAAHDKSWNAKLKAGDSILVCDIGGGTTDFSLIEVQDKEDILCFSRRAVGNHLLLGGDNMDAAIAYHIEDKIAKEQSKSDLSKIQQMQIRLQARIAKEQLLSSHEVTTVLIQGTGSSIVKGSFTTQLNKGEIEKLLINGFFGQYDLEEALKIKKSAGLRTMGLPFEEEASITKHMAAFLKKSNHSKAPDYILFNGGALKPSLFQQALLQSLKRWYPQSETNILESVSLDLAVAQGAAYYGKVRRGIGVRISGGIPRAYYLGIEVKKSEGVQEHRALTLLPRGSEEGMIYEPSQIFSIRPNTPVSFSLYTSQVRLDDQKGDLIEIDPKELQSLPAIQTILRMGKKQLNDSSQEPIQVKLHIGLTALGTLELWLQSLRTEHRWNLEFQLRNSEGQEDSVLVLKSARKYEMFDSTFLIPAKEYITDIFKNPSKSDKIMDTLETLIGQPRREWSISVLRGLWDSLLSVATQRKVTQEMEARWWNLAGFFLRPGFGYPLDDSRIKEMWKILLSDFKSTKGLEVQIQQWICFRRVSGGFNKGQQIQIANDFLTSLFPNKASKIVLKSKNEIYPYSEKIRVLASFEFLDIQTKIKLGNAILNRMNSGEAHSADFWALGRLGARHLVYGTITNVIPKEECTNWIQSLLKIEQNDELAHLLSQLARKTNQREIDLSTEMINSILSIFRGTAHEERLSNLLTQASVLTLKEQEQVFGDKLPSGIILET